MGTIWAGRRNIGGKWAGDLLEMGGAVGFRWEMGAGRMVNGRVVGGETVRVVRY